MINLIGEGLGGKQVGYFSGNECFTSEMTWYQYLIKKGNEMCRRAYEKVIAPTLYWLCVIACGFAFLYMNSLYMSYEAGELASTEKIEKIVNIPSEIVLHSSFEGLIQVVGYVGSVLMDISVIALMF